MKNTAYSIILILAIAAGGTAYAEGYIIGEEDVLQLSVWGTPELNVTVPVRPDGKISMPLLGDVEAAGATPLELKKKLERDLAKYVKTPVVSVIVTAVNSFKVYLFGDGAPRAAVQGGNAPSNAPSGQVILRRNTTLLQLLAQLGSLNDIDLANAYLLRDGRKLLSGFENLVANGDASQHIKLEPNDVIYLPGGFTSRIRVIGAVKSPGVLPYSSGMTALDAVLSAGGFTEFASQNSVLIVRKEGNLVKNFEVRLKDVIKGDVRKNVFLKPGDIVTIRTGIF